MVLWAITFNPFNRIFLAIRFDRKASIITKTTDSAVPIMNALLAPIPSFTSQDFINKLLEYGIAISMDGRGRVFDNIFVERLWRTVKYENIYISGYQNIPELKGGLRRYFNFYNMERYHQALDYKRPWEVYSGSIIMPGGVIQENYGGYILSA